MGAPTDKQTHGGSVAAVAEADPSHVANEDSSIGFMLSRLPDVTYVSMAKGSWHNLGCFAWQPASLRGRSHTPTIRARSAVHCSPLRCS